MPTISDWENRFREDIEKIAQSPRLKAGALLSVVPDREVWNEFLDVMKTFWRRASDEFPCCLLILYDGLAFYEYEKGEFWPQFAEAVGSEPLPANQQGEMNESFAKVARKYNLKIRRQPSSTDYVGSAVHHVGVPLSLWDEFLEICEWMLVQDHWSGWSDEEWREVATRRAGGRTRLKNFLLDNRETASEFIQEMHKARRRLSEDQSLKISDLQQASLLRQEYFDEVPETAEFLRPEDPDSLVRDRARLVWDDDQARLYLQLPAVSTDKLPATWKIGALTQEAASTPDTLTLNAEAFAPFLVLDLESGQQNTSQRLQGIAPWGLFDAERKRFVNPKRQQLPIREYTLVSSEPFAVSHQGFDEEDSPINDPYELEDGTVCHVTRLFPVEEQAELSIAPGGVTKKLTFHPQPKIEGGPDAINWGRYERSENHSQPLTDSSQLAVGDYVVHREYGTAQYHGLRYLTFEKTPGRYLCLEYAEGDKLYVPNKDVGLVRKYRREDKKKPTLARLKKTQKRIKRSK